MAVSLHNRKPFRTRDQKTEAKLRAQKSQLPKPKKNQVRGPSFMGKQGHWTSPVDVSYHPVPRKNQE